MAMSGSLTTGLVENNYFMQIDWSMRYDLSRMVGKLTVKAYINASNPPYPNRVFRIYDSGSNYVKVDGITIWSKDLAGDGSYNNPYPVITQINCVSTESKAYIENWTGGAPAWVFTYAHLSGTAENGWVYEKEIPINDDGYCVFTLEGRSYTRAGSAYARMDVASTEIHTDPVEVNSKIGHKTGGSWGNDGRIWHKEGGQWIKRNLYRKESGSWNKK